MAAKPKAARSGIPTRQKIRRTLLVASLLLMPVVINYGPPFLVIEGSANRVNCLTCNQVCSKSLDVNAMVQSGSFANPECILCGNCVDTCPKGNIRYAFRWSR